VLDVFGVVRRALRVWRRAPGVALAVVALLALGIAGVAALFSPLYALILSPLPFPAPERLVRMGSHIPVFNGYTNTFDERDRLGSIFINVMAYAPVMGYDAEADFLATGRPTQVNMLAVTPEFFETLGVLPRMGKGFANERIDAPVIVLSDRLWRTAFESSDRVIGMTVRIGGQARPVVGVMPETFDFPGGVDVWVLMGTVGYASPGLERVGRLRPGFSVEQAATHLEAIPHTRAPGATGPLAGDGPSLQTLQTYLRGDLRATLWMLWAVSGLFLLVACVGVVNLLLAHSVRRRPEIVVQLALGAGRWRLVRQLLTEILVLAIGSALIGLWLSTLAGRWLQTQMADLQAGPLFVPATLALGVALTFVVTMVCGLVPALHATRVELSAALAAGASRASGLLSRRRFFEPREYLTGLQVALALALLVGTALLLRSLSAQIDKPLGLQPDDVAVFQARLPMSPGHLAAMMKFRNEHHMTRRGYGPRHDAALLENQARTLAPERRAERVRNALFLRDAYDRLGKLPNVVSVGVFSPTPFTPHAALRMLTFISAADQAGAGDPPRVRALRGWTSTNGFDILGIRLLRGRAFNAEDVASTLAVELAKVSADDQAERRDGQSGPVIINEALAQRLWPHENPVGKLLKDIYDQDPHLVVGVVSNFYSTADAASSGPAVYSPWTGHMLLNTFVVKLQAGASAQALSPEIDRVVNELMPGIPRVDVRDLKSLTEATQRSTRLALVLLGWFSLLGTTAAALGVYTASTLMASARKRDIAIRIALGASVTSIRWWILSRSARLLLVAIPFGLLAGWVLARQLSHLLFEVTGTDLATYTISVVLLLIVTLTASLLPALYAGTTDPVVALRSE